MSTQHSSFASLLAAVQALPGYIPSFRPTTDAVREDVSGTIHVTRRYTYRQEVSGGRYKDREALVREVLDANGSPTEWHLHLAVASETNTGEDRVVLTFGDPDRFSPRVTSLAGRMARDGSSATQWYRGQAPTQTTPVGVKWDLTPGTPVAYWKATFTFEIVNVRHGLQQAVACWARANEGDFCEVAIDLPSSAFAWQPSTAYTAGATAICINDGNMYICVSSGTSATSGGPTGTTPNTPIVDGTAVWYYVSADPVWVEGFKFADFITIFDTNAKGTAYPTTPTPAVSWLEVGWRVRVDMYKLAQDDPERTLGQGETEANTPTKRGPFLDIDLLFQLERV